MISVVLFTLSNLALCLGVSAAEKYKPIFTVDVPKYTGPSRTLLGDYVDAAASDTTAIALRRWEDFLEYHTYGEPIEVEDLTHLYFVRLAYLELSRLYYLDGRVEDGDRLLRGVVDLTVYSSPYIEGAKEWCETNRHCR